MRRAPPRMHAHNSNNDTTNSNNNDKHNNSLSSSNNNSNDNLVVKCPSACTRTTAYIADKPSSTKNIKFDLS